MLAVDHEVKLFLTRKQFALELSLSIETVDWLIATRSIRIIQARKLILIPRSELRRFANLINMPRL